LKPHLDVDTAQATVAVSINLTDVMGWYSRYYCVLLTYYNAEFLNENHLFLGRIAAKASDGRLLLHIEQHGRPVGLSVCLLVTFASRAKMAKPMEMFFGMLTHMGPRNHY